MSNICHYVCSVYILLVLAYGCAYAPPDANEQIKVNLPVQSLDRERLFWWYTRFRINWPDNTAPDFSVDTLLADAVVEPLLVQNHENIKLWRFHRRAGRDDAGHQFSFIFYTNRNTAEKIFKNLKNSDLTKKLLAHKIIVNITTDNIETNQRTGINSTSDQNWSDTLQNAWPYFIMGVSATWLELINQQLNQPATGLNLENLLIMYRDINEKINRIWHEEGQHAFFHHLNALFGYEPLGNVQ